MNNSRRNFMKTSMFVGVAGVIGTSLTACTSNNESSSKITLSSSKGVIYSFEDQGRWKGKSDSHSPIISVNGKTVTVETNHGMSESHYIVKHTLLSEIGEVLGEKVFTPKDERAISTFELKEDFKHLFATSFCNLHDMWISEYKA